MNGPGVSAATSSITALSVTGSAPPADACPRMSGAIARYRSPSPDPTTAIGSLLGDLTLAHDIGGLLAARRLDLKLTIVLINNDGGGIFSFLPVSAQGEIFEQQIATPVGLNYADAAALYSCRHQIVDSFEAFAEALMSALAGDVTTIIEVTTDRLANHRLHTQVAIAATTALGDGEWPEAR